MTIEQLGKLAGGADNDKQDAVAPAQDARYAAKATEAAVKFEAFFISHMLRQMRSSTRELAAEDSTYKDPVNSDMLEMADNLVADKMAGQRAFGIADAILRQLLPPPAAAKPRGATPTAGHGPAPDNLAGTLNKPA
ncbi:rod-binding protein [Janthinobacterium agaricidamnosum]|uniref:Flagellar FlgJ domain protein n=1 Tax=Janthinobacterium agaricidamnosum NBRC 102515 = DSM 9628 TaxID=1349767 RepID=W0V4N1_9BURK|nr:rod-binding protein [Janthinobacterium agaricidamnosum]CDG82540.1 flagellar FlgJ domain protein [Janthinobacterium agaricidamnosum NBRC 102515 = DSM 9628]